MRKRLYIFINGILSNPGDSRGWTDRAVVRTHLETPFAADRFEYFTTAVLKQLHQDDRVLNLADIISQYDDTYDVCLVGHSNGADIITRYLLKYPTAILREIHLVAGATQEDCRKNGINRALAARQIGDVFFYCSSNDEILKAGDNAFLRWGYRLCGYGFLGLRGPKYLIKTPHAVTHWVPFKHSEYFKVGPNFDYMMRLIMRPGMVEVGND